MYISHSVVVILQVNFLLNRTVDSLKTLSCLKEYLSAIPSDLMKSTIVDESLSSMNQQFCSRENQLVQLLQQNEKLTSM